MFPKKHSTLLRAKQEAMIQFHNLERLARFVNRYNTFMFYNKTLYLIKQRFAFATSS